MNEELKVPEIQVSPPPKVEPVYKEIVSYINYGKQIRSFKDSLQGAYRALLYVPVLGWTLYAILWAATEVLFGIIILIADIIDGLWNSIAELINSLYVWWLNFKRAVEERYQGNWWKAIVELTIRVLLLYALDYALNIPAIKQFWDIFVEYVKKINNFIVSVKNWVYSAFDTIRKYINSSFSSIDQFIKYFLREELQFWNNQINSLISKVESGLLKVINSVESNLVNKLNSIVGEVNSIRAKIERFEREAGIKVMNAIVDSVMRVASIRVEREPWIEEKETYTSLDRTVRYSMPGQVESTYKTTIRVNNALVSPQILFRTFVSEMFDDRTGTAKEINEAVDIADRVIDSLFEGKEEWIPITAIVQEILNIERDAQEQILEAQKKMGV